MNPPIRVVPRVKPRPYLYDGGVAFYFFTSLDAFQAKFLAYGFRGYSAGFSHLQGSFNRIYKSKKMGMVV